ncbi:CAP domain-containing protein [Actinoplanes sp. NPDC051411]|uniref:CAP domain-containing protein n=1 Tax=Actinoplanes sp. NPDC051411 TaxID=3155522 RepID=UPI003428D797
MSAAARFRCTLVAGATAVVIGTGFAVVGLTRHADAQTQVPRAADAPLAAAVDPSTAPAGLLPSTAAAPTPTPSLSSSPKPKPSAKSPTPKQTTSKAARNPSRSKITVVTTDDSVLGQVLAHINAARADAGLSALTLDDDLSKASTLHNQLMINGCGLEHQCPGEESIGPRFSAQGVQWTSAGENIGFGSSGGSDADIIKAANGLTDSMLAEKPPNDGHRKNLLNTGFKRIGLSVVRDSKGITWMTQDFVN